MSGSVTTTGRGRPPIGPRLTITVPPEVLADIDAAAAAAGITRPAEIRRRLDPVPKRGTPPTR